MTLRNRISKLLALVALASSLVTVPAHAADLMIDTKKITLPAGVTLTDFKVVKIEGCTAISYMLNTSDSSNYGKVFKLADFKVAGLPSGASDNLNPSAYDGFRDTAQEITPCLTDADLSAETGTLYFSGVGTVEQFNNFAFPKSFGDIPAKLEKLGFAVTNGYQSYGGSGVDGSNHYIYVEGKLKEGVAPFVIKIKNPTFSATGITPVSLTNSGNGVKITADTYEIKLGQTKFDTMIGDYQETKVTADFAIAAENTYKTNVQTPAGLEVTFDYANNYYNAQSKSTGFYIKLRNTTMKTISFDPSALQITQTVNGKTSVIAKPAADWGYISLRPKPDFVPEGECYYDCFSNYLNADGEYLYDSTLELKGKLVLAVPSKINTSKVKLPAGFKVAPPDFNNIWYDAKKKVTSVLLEVSTEKYLTAPPALAIAKLSLLGGKIDTTSPYVNGWANEKAKLLTYGVTIGTIKGDARKGKTITVGATMATVARTPLTDTAVAEAGLDQKNVWINSPAVAQPEQWKYNSKTKSTEISAYVQTYKLAEPVDIYFCKLTITIDGVSVTPASKPWNLIQGKEDNSWALMTIASVPGDIRVKGKAVVISGTFTSVPCS
ncbi:MAG: hypothetical protein NT152_01120 [Actinobacteria bacterium]|nr:hypothetical protein [Actinomycetota bacterium]